MNKTIIRVLLGSSALFWATTAMAQDPAPQPAETAEPDPSDATADAAIAEAAPVDDAQAHIELLQAQVEALQEALDERQGLDGQDHAVVEGRAAVRGQGSRLVVQAARPPPV